MVPTRDQESMNLSMANTILIEKLIAELKRLRNLPGVKLELDRDVQDIFFVELMPLENMDEKLKQFMNIVVQKFRALGSWSDDHSFMLNSFLQERFLMAGIVREANEKLEVLRSKAERSDAELLQMSEAITRLNIHNIGLRKSLEELVASLQDISGRDVDGKIKVMLEGIALRGRTVLDSDMALDRDRLFDSQNHSSFLSSLETERQRIRLRTLESELASFHDGESERNRHLRKQIVALEGEIEQLRTELNSSRSSIKIEAKPEHAKVALLQLEIDRLNEQLSLVKQEYERKFQRLRESSEKDLNEARRFASIMTTASSASEQVEHLRNLNIELESKLRAQQNEITLINNRKSQLEFELSKKQAEMETLSRKLQDSIIGGEFRSSFRPDNLVSSRTVIRQGQSDYEEATGIRRPPADLSASAVIRSFDSPDVRQTIRYGTPADMQRSQQGNFQSTLTQPASLQQVRTVREPSDLSSSQTSVHQPRTPEPSMEKRSLTLRELRDLNANEKIIAQVMIKVMEKVNEETLKGRYMSYSPENIHISNFSLNGSLDELRVRLGDPIDRSNPATQLYLAPEILRGDTATDKSSNFNLAVIWDELLNGSPYFKTTAEIESPTCTLSNYVDEYKSRNTRLLPLYKNTLYEMLKKDSQRRITLTEVLRRMVLQHTIVPAEQQSQGSRARKEP